MSNVKNSPHTRPVFSLGFTDGAKDRDYLWEGIDGISRQELVEASCQMPRLFGKVHTADTTEKVGLGWIAPTSQNKGPLGQTKRGLTKTN